MAIADLERFPVALVCAAMDASLAYAGGMRGVHAPAAPMVRRWTLQEVPPCFDSAKEWRGWSMKNEETAHPERWRGLPCVDCVGQAEMIALGRCANAHVELPLLDVDDVELPAELPSISVGASAWVQMAGYAEISVSIGSSSGALGPPLTTKAVA